MATKAQLRTVFGTAWHVNAEAIYDLIASDGSGGAGIGGVFTDLTISGAAAITGTLTVAGATVLNGGVKLGDAVTDLIGFYGTAPVAQPSSANDAIVATAAIGAVGTTGSTTTTPFGYTTSTQADAIVTAINLVITRAGALTTLLNQIRADLISLGAIKGAA